MTVATRTDETIRRDLIGALAACVAQKGYASTTISDVVALARVSKRTFYEHFSGKEDCLLALYAHVTGRLMNIIRAAGGADQRFQLQIAAGTKAFLSALDSMPEFTRTLLVEMQGAGPRAFRMRQETLRGFARTIVDLVEVGRAANPEIKPLAMPRALAIVGGINELLLHAIDPYAGPSTVDGVFSALYDDVVSLITALLLYDGSAPM
ncbi:TetR/AcrR family transcriptional regulator [Allorhizocola rhizosphaerae]|uniref:TetR/AcrR family transcriptional regulator n=1 Tax=Allorhizocola rhizosphaerae TaxID=1872709 RepID=UPI0013C32EE5|nr:TetR/AcrR family transcriptional regulator [Allorhizocola rhizosphaerae]